jgi:hypothetical protein
VVEPEPKHLDVDAQIRSWNAVIFSLLGVALRYAHTALRENTLSERNVGALLAALAGLLIVGSVFSAFLMAYFPLADAYASGRTQVTEGRVRVRFAQPASGHASGDAIVIGTTPFTIDHFVSSPGYTKTIAYQGILTEGRYVRVVSYDGVILRIDVTQPPPPVGPPRPKLTSALLP